MLLRRFCAFVVLLCLTEGVLSAQNVIDLLPGNQIANGTVIADGTTVNVLGGNIGLGVDLSNGVLNIESGQVAIGATGIPTGFTNSNNQVNVSGGDVGGFFQLFNGTELNLTGGQLNSFGVFSGSTANISGGTVTRFPDIFSSGTVNISGGNVFAIRVFTGGEVNLFGTEFAIDGTPIDLVLGEEFVISDRNVTLTGTLSDGSFIENSLNTTFGGFFSSEPDGVAAGARVTVTRVVEPVILGDVDRNGVVEFSDIPPFIALLISGDFQEEADIDENESVGFSDIPPFIVILIEQTAA